jgi:hypothetical protein
VYRQPVAVTAEPAASRMRGASLAFTVTMFSGAALLFLVQPMFAKLVLPRLGGSPSVWNTCMVFFQAALLLGYAYAHLTTKWLGARRQATWHMLVLLVPLVSLPIATSSTDPSTDHPVRWLLATMTLSVGLPFFTVATTAPLLQRWFATLPLPSARDPYFLYAASNVGSVMSLLAYPLVLEPLIGVRQQTMLWTAGYLMLIVMTGCCAWLVHTRGDEARLETNSADERNDSPVTTSDRMLWVILAFVPSSLMLGVTSYITADLAAVPLLWVLPLAIYLLTFVLAFSKRRLIPEGLLTILGNSLVVLSLLTIFVNSHRWTLVPFHLITFFAGALLCHYRLAARRPHVSHLTEYYLWLSVGGVLGGVFNSLVAPQTFSTVLEYPLVLGLVPVVIFFTREEKVRSLRVTGMQLAAAAACLASGALWFAMPSTPATGVLVAVIVGLCGRHVLTGRSAGAPFIALTLVALIASGWFSVKGTVLFTGRSFFGVHRVVEAEDGTHRLLYHGSTVHGRQELNAGNCPLSSYYFPDGPIGQVMNMTRERRLAVAVVGLGTGTLACFAEPGEAWTFYEIDPMMDHLARHSGLLTQMHNSAGVVSVVLGDGRLKIQSAAPRSYDVIILDAFSSDAVPIHLLTREAIRLYLSRLKSTGLLVANISNRYVNLRPVLATTARLEGLQVRTRFDGNISDADGKRGRSASHWMVLARDAAAFQSLDGLAGWQTPPIDGGVRPWTDDYSNLLQTLMLR